jgi:hypothetical protein
MKVPPYASAALAVVASLLAGCESARVARIRQNPELFASLDPFSQHLIKQGLFNKGFSTEAVYMALGKPNAITVTESPDGRLETWVYKNFLYESSNAVSVSVVSPGSRPLGTVLSSSAPGGPSLNSTKAGPGQAAIAEDTALCTLFIDLLENRVVAARIKP